MRSTVIALPLLVIGCAQNAQPTATVTCVGDCVFDPGQESPAIAQFAVKGGGGKGGGGTGGGGTGGGGTGGGGTGGGGTGGGGTGGGGSGGGGGATACSPQLTTKTVLVSEEFTDGAGIALWPQNIGWEGDFNGDWITDGATARPQNPLWGDCPTCPIPAVTGIVKRVELCPESGARITFTADIAPQTTSAESHASLVMYVYDGGGKLLDIKTSYPRFSNVPSNLAFYDYPLPYAARLLLIVPMVYLAADEQGSIFFDRVRVDYTPRTADVVVATIAQDNFSTYGPTEYGDYQPAGWAEFGGDWFVDPNYNWATLWNTTWGGGPGGLPPVDAGMVKTFDLGAWQAGTVVNLKALAAVQFTDPDSLAQLRLIFNDAAGTTYESQRIKHSNWDDLVIRHAPIPAGATTGLVVVNAFLGPTEIHSLYVDDLSFTLVRP